MTNNEYNTLSFSQIQFSEHDSEETPTVFQALYFSSSRLMWLIQILQWVSCLFSFLFHPSFIPITLPPLCTCGRVRAQPCTIIAHQTKWRVLFLASISLRLYLKPCYSWQLWVLFFFFFFDSLAKGKGYELLV